MNWTREKLLNSVFRGARGGCQHLEELSKENRDMLLAYLDAREAVKNAPLPIMVNAAVGKPASYPINAITAAGFTPYDSMKFFDKLRSLSGDDQVAIGFVLCVHGEMNCFSVVDWRRFWLGL